MSTRRAKPLGRRIVENLGKKWVQVILAVVAFLIAVGASHRFLVKAKPATEAEKAKEKAAFKYMHCDKCKKEMPYNPELADKPAMSCKCKQGDGGFWTATKESVTSGGNDRLKWYYSAVILEALVLLTAIYFLLARKDADPPFFYVRCVHCREMLRYTKEGFDLLVACPQCQEPIRLPDEDEARTEEDHQEEQTESLILRYEDHLRATGYEFPTDKPHDDATDRAG